MEVKLEEGFLSRVLGKAHVERDQRERPDQSSVVGVNKRVEVGRPCFFADCCLAEFSVWYAYGLNLLRRIAPTSPSFTLSKQKRLSGRISLLLIYAEYSDVPRRPDGVAGADFQ
jgi:hypothetical protein